MDEVIGVESPKLVDAVRIWSGWGGIAPSRDDSRLRQKFGKEDGDRLLSVIKRLEEDFYSSGARYMASDVDEMGRLAEEDFRHLHPHVAAEIAAIFSRCYTFDFK